MAGAAVVPTAIAAVLLSGLTGCSADPAPRIAILISVDTLRADRLGAYGNPLGLTPNLDALAAESHRFESAYAPTSFTLPSVSALLTGRYPEELGVHGNRSALADSIPTLATAFRSRGWRTGAVVSNFVLRRNSGLATGFEHYDDAMLQREIVRDWPERIAGPTTDAFVSMLDRLLDSSDAKVFGWVHYQDPHGPYTPPDGFRERYLEVERSAKDGARQLLGRAGKGGRGTLPSYQEIEGERGIAFYRAGYDGEIAYLDREIGRLLDALDERGWRDRSVVVFTADHGEALGEDDYWFAHGERLTDPLVRVPLMIRTPAHSPEVRGDVASLLDVFPTMLALTGDGSDDTRGRNLMTRSARPDSVPYLATLDGATQTRFGIVDGAYKLVVTRSRDQTDSVLYRRDAAGVETAVHEPAVADRLRDRLSAFRASLPRGKPELRQNLTPEDQQRLRALGYAESERKPK